MVKSCAIGVALLALVAYLAGERRPGPKAQIVEPVASVESPPPTPAVAPRAAAIEARPAEADAAEDGSAGGGAATESAGPSAEYRAALRKTIERVNAREAGKAKKRAEARRQIAEAQGALMEEVRASSGEADVARGGSGLCGATTTVTGEACRNRVAGGGRCYLHR